MQVQVFLLQLILLHCCLLYVDSNISTLELDLPYSQYSICITKPGYIPYIITKEHGTEYLQNETIEDEYSINCNNVVIGSNVTTTIPEGPVILENGSEVDIHGITNVYIKNDFTVKQGATLNITTGNQKSGTKHQTICLSDNKSFLLRYL